MNATTQDLGSPAVNQPAEWAPYLPIAIGTALRLMVLFSAVQHTANAIFLDNYLSVAYEWMRTHTYTHTFFPPLTAFVGSLAIKIFGLSAPAAFLAYQCILSSAMLVLTYTSTRALTGSRNAGVAATWIAAIDPLCLIIPAFVLTETSYMFLLSLFLTLLATALRSKNYGVQLPISLVAGLALGALVLCRETGYLVGASAILGVLLFYRPRQRASLCVMILLVGALIPIVPWGLHMHAQYGHFATSSSSAYNTAALLIRPAKVIVDGRDPMGMLAPWDADMASQPHSDNPFVVAEQARNVALRFASEHKMLVLRTFVTGAILRQFAPGDEFAAALLHPIDGKALPPYDIKVNPVFLQSSGLALRVSLSLARLLIFCCTCAGIWLVLRNRDARMPAALWICLIVLLVTELALGPIHGGRYLCNLLPTWYPFAGLGLLAFMRRSSSLPK